jgi:hypothetical protein
VGAEAQAGASRQRDWFLWTLLVLQRPGAVFAALNDDSEESAEARQEPMLAVLWLAGMAAVLAAPVARTFLDDPAVGGGLVVAVWTFIAGGLSGALAYWLLGACVYAAAHVLGGQGSYRRARHLVGLAAVPLAASLLVVWPIAIAVYGSDLFHEGGRDSGTGGSVLGWVEAGVGLWCIGLLAVGIRAVHGWTWLRSLATLALAAAPVVLYVLVAHYVRHTGLEFR